MVCSVYLTARAQVWHVTQMPPVVTRFKVEDACATVVIKVMGQRVVTLMSAWLIRTTVTPMQTVSILLAHTAASVNQVTKGPDSFVNLTEHAQESDVTQMHCADGK